MCRQKSQCIELVRIFQIHKSIINNFCRIEGRGKSVIAEAIVPASRVESVLKCSPQSLVELAHVKLNIGSSSAVCIGGSNAHSANIVAAMFIATGQVGFIPKIHNCKVVFRTRLKL